MSQGILARRDRSTAAGVRAQAIGAILSSAGSARTRASQVEHRRGVNGHARAGLAANADGWSAAATAAGSSVAAVAAVAAVTTGSTVCIRGTL